MQVFVLAGGFATRLWPLTERRAKPLLPVAGKPLLSYAVDAIPAELPVTVSTNAAFEKDFKAWQKTCGRKSLTVSIEDAGHEGEKLGALGAVARWVRQEKISDDILLLAGDNYAACDLKKFISLFRGKPLVAGHDIGDTETARQFGTIIMEGNGELRRVTSFEEKPLHPKSTVVSTGWWILPKESLPVLVEYAAMKPDNVGGVFEEFLTRGMEIDCWIFPELWKDIGSFESYLSLHRALVGERTLAHKTASTDAKTILKSSIDLGPDTVVKASTLQDCIVFGKANITDCVLERCILDEGCVLQGVDLRDQMLRAGTVLRIGG